MGAKKVLNNIFRSGYSYAKAGVLLSQFSNPTIVQQSLFGHMGGSIQIKQDDRLMQCIDTMNADQAQIYYASQHPKKLTATHKKIISPKYTTNWWDLPIAN